MHKYTIGSKSLFGYTKIAYTRNGKAVECEQQYLGLMKRNRGGVNCGQSLKFWRLVKIE